jgi:hypothetical protein
MSKAKNLSKSVANVVFSPTLAAYFCVAVKYVITGVILYMIFSAAAYRMQIFKCLRSWPNSSKAALFSSPLLISVGIYWSTQTASYWMMIPAVIYMMLSIAGGLALVGKCNT